MVFILKTIIFCLTILWLINFLKIFRLFHFIFSELQLLDLKLYFIIKYINYLKLNIQLKNINTYYDDIFSDDIGLVMTCAMLKICAISA